MALLTAGTKADSSLSALLMTGAMAQADIAAFAAKIQDPAPVAGTTTANYPIFPGGFSQNGFLFIPERGVLRVLPGDYVMVDHSGWPILVAKTAIADGSTSWAHS